MKAHVQLVSLLSISGGLIVAGSSIYSATSTLDLLNQSLFEKVSLADPMKMFLSLNLFLSLVAFVMTLVSSYMVLKGQSRIGVATNVAGIN